MNLTEEIYSTLLMSTSSTVLEAVRELKECSPNSPKFAHCKKQFLLATDAHQFVTEHLSRQVAK